MSVSLAKDDGHHTDGDHTEATCAACVMGEPMIHAYERIILEVDATQDVCPACGEFPDFCQGHGEIGDPWGHSILSLHDSGSHRECHSMSGCRD